MTFIINDHFQGDIYKTEAKSKIEALIKFIKYKKENIEEDIIDNICSDLDLEINNINDFQEI